MFIAIWELVVDEDHRLNFEQAYGPDGRWSQFFRSGAGFIDTKLVRDSVEPSRYLTLDFWQSKADYDRFLQQHQDEYRQIDAECGALTKQDRKIGWFEEVE